MVNELVWGISCFVCKGYNFFGFWCFSKGCGFVLSRWNEGVFYEVVKFDSLFCVIYIYMCNLNCYDVYEDLCEIRSWLRVN